MGSLGGALGQVGEGIQNLPGNIYQQSGLESLGQGLQSLFGGGPDEAGYLQSLGQAVPAGVELVGPSPTFQGPGFLGSLIPGVQGGTAYANPSAGTQAGQGVGQLLAFLEKLRQQGGAPMGPLVPTPGGATPGGIRMLPGYHAAQAPSGGLIHNLIGSFTYGLLGGAIPSSGQV
jgi:hypothetical protein